MTFAVTGYEFGLFIHIVAVLVAFGPTFAYPLFLTAAEKTDPRSLPAVIRGVHLSDRFLVTPGLVVILLAGIYMLAEGEISAGESWVTVGFMAIIILFVMAVAFFTPKSKKALELAERDLKSGADLSDEYRAVSRQIATGGQFATLIVLVTIFFMVVKP